MTLTKQFARSNLTGTLLRRLLISWILAATAEYLLLSPELRRLNTLDGLKEMSFARLLIVTLALFAVLNLLFCFVIRSMKVERYFLAAAFAVLSVFSLLASFSWAFLAADLLILAVLAVYAVYGRQESVPARKYRGQERNICLWITVALSGLIFLFICVWTVCRVCSFSTPTFDFSIFSQMFYNMKQTGLPVTTVERDGPLSHFKVHVSPVYYLLLPFYILFPEPATLQVLQAAVIVSAVLPLWKLGKLHGLSPLCRMLLCAVMLFYPAFSGGTSYDIHENAFLLPLLLWLFYGIDRKNAVITVLATVLTLFVKEDAPVYTAVVGLYLFLRSLLDRDGNRKWELIAGAGIMAASIAWFILVTGYLAGQGDGVMTYRYSNFIFDGSGSLFTVIRAVLLSPMKAVYECVDAEKLRFIALTMLPLLGLPLLTRRYERILLLIPYVLVNLMSDYQYQHDIFFQYTFGSTACLMYMMLRNAGDLKPGMLRPLALTAAACAGIVCFSCVVVPKAIQYPRKCIQYHSYYTQVRQTLSVIPDDASVTATTFYTTYLSQRETLYDVRYSSKEHLLSTQYVVLAVNDDYSCKNYAVGGKNGYNNLIKLLEKNGYELFAELEDTLVIYKRPDP